MFKAVFNDVQFSVYDSVMIAVAVGLLIQAKFIGYFGVMVVWGVSMSLIRRYYRHK